MLAAVDVDLDASAVDEHAQVKRTGCELGVAELGHPVAFVAVRHVLPVDDDAADLRVEHDCRVVAVACGMHMQSGAFGGGFMQIEAHLNLQCTPSSSRILEVWFVPRSSESKPMVFSRSPSISMVGAVTRSPSSPSVISRGG